MNQQAMHRQLTTLRSLVQFIDYPLFKHLAKCDALNMFFAFRWLLIWFKREYSMPDVLRLWDVCLSDARSPDYQLFVALAMLETARADVMGTCTAFDSILKLANEMSDNVPAEPVLEEAEMLFAVFENKLRAAQARVHAQAIAGGEDGVEPVVPGTFPKIGSLDLELSKSLAGLATRMPPPVPYHDSRPGTPA
ncbi:rab-GTPase-TBC domain-containing protein [Blastocladiella britannica]|nr:rab-GTPase-TBC domain-containing protein [Blastocladiella britannica]